MTRLIILCYLLDIIVLAVCADHSTINCLVNTIMSGSQDTFSFPHPVDPSIDVAIMGDGEVSGWDARTRLCLTQTSKVYAAT
jgi:hypothetical protein